MSCPRTHTHTPISKSQSSKWTSFAAKDIEVASVIDWRGRALAVGLSNLPSLDCNWNGQGHGHWSGRVRDWVRWPKRPTIYLLQVVQRSPKIENIMLLRFKISQTLSINFSSHFLGFSVCDDTPFHYFLLLLLSMMINKQSGRASVAQKKRWGRAAQNNNCYWGQIWMDRIQNFQRISDTA